MPSTHIISLFSLLSLNVGDGEWWLAYTLSGKVTSFKHVNQGGALVEWRVVSWGWSIDGLKFKSEPSMFTLKRWTSLSKLLRTELVCLAMKCGDSGEGDKTELLEFLTGLTLEN